MKEGKQDQAYNHSGEDGGELVTYAQAYQTLCSQCYSAVLSDNTTAKWRADTIYSKTDGAGRASVYCNLLLSNIYEGSVSVDVITEDTSQSYELGSSDIQSAYMCFCGNCTIYTDLAGNILDIG